MIFSAWIWIGANYSKKGNILRIILQISLISIAYFIPLYLVKTINDSIVENQIDLNDNKISQGNTKLEDVVITPTSKHWYEVEAFCKNKNMALASIENIIERINSNKNPKGIYWTDEKYPDDKSLYWTINFTKFKENEYPLNMEKIRKTKNVMMAYKQNTYLAIGLCVRK